MTRKPRMRAVKAMPSNYEIRGVYAAIETMEPDISTEQLIARTADSCGVEWGDVVCALADTEVPSKAKP